MENAPLVSNDLRIYPNPAKDQCFIQLPENSDVAVVNIFDVSGKLVLSKNLNQLNSTYSLEIQSLSEGMYLIEINTNDKLYTGRLVKN